MRNSIKQLMMVAPSDHLDPQMIPLIKKWDSPPSAVQVLEVLDKCIHAGLSSDLATMALQATYDDCLRHEKTTHVDIVKLATWRK